MCFIVLYLCCQKNWLTGITERSHQKLDISGCWHDLCLAVCRDDDLHPDELTEQCEGKCQDFEPTYPTQDYVLPDEEQFPSWRNLIHVYRFHHCPVFRLVGWITLGSIKVPCGRGRLSWWWFGDSGWWVLLCHDWAWLCITYPVIGLPWQSGWTLWYPRIFGAIVRSDGFHDVFFQR